MNHARMLPLLVLAVASGCAAKAATPSDAAPALPIAVEPARAVSAEPAFRGSGTLAAAHVYRVGFELAGRVTTVRYDVGDRVEAGATLAAIDDADARQSLEAAAARAASSEAAARKAGAGPRPQERFQAEAGIRTAQAEIDRARAQQVLADTNARRGAQLFADGDIAAQTNDTYQQAARDAAGRVAAARATLAQAREALSLVNAGARSEDRAAAVADAAAARANAALAATMLRKTTIVAPAASYVLQRAVELGSEAQPGVAAFVLTDAAATDVLVAVPEALLAAVHVGDGARVRIGGHTFAGRVARIEPAADLTTRTAQARVVVPLLHAPPGSIADVAIGAAHRTAAASVPLPALLTETDGSTAVAVLSPSGASVRHLAVRVRGTDGDRALVDGIAPGTRVVVAGAHLARVGAPVRVVSLAEAGAR